jgi:hypothetical protein
MAFGAVITLFAAFVVVLGMAGEGAPWIAGLCGMVLFGGFVGWFVSDLRKARSAIERDVAAWCQPAGAS